MGVRRTAGAGGKRMELVVIGESIFFLGDTEKSTQTKRSYTDPFNAEI